MAEGYEIAAYRPELAGAVARLHTHLWSPSPDLNAAFFAWKYDENPYLQPPCVVVALHGGEVVGMAGAMGARWAGGDPPQRIDVGLTGDTVIEPAHRAQGLLGRLKGAVNDELARRGHAYAFAASASRAVQLHLLSAGWRAVGPRERLQWPPPATTSRGGKVLARVRRAALRRAALRPPAQDGERAEVGEASPRAAEMAALALRTGTGGRLRHVRDEEYVGWRYRNPRAEYRFLFAGDAGRDLDGYLVLTAGPGTPTAAVADWAADRPDVLRGLLQAAVGTRRYSTIVVPAMSTTADERGALHDAGFRALPTAREGLLVARLGDAGGAWELAGMPLLDASSYALRAIDSDAG